MSYLNILEKYDGNLRKGGQEYWIVCPFHKEKKPSLNVNVASGVFYCFGCQKKGWIHEIVSSLEGISLSAAFKYVTKRGGRRKKGFKKEKVILEESVLDNFFEVESRDYIDYLEKRGISKDTATVASVMEGNMLARGWNYRVIFPIRNLDGQLVSVEGRAVRDSMRPKHYKWPGSQSSEGFFGIDLINIENKVFEFITGCPVESAGNETFVFLVEGIFDCLSMIQSGYRSMAMSMSSLSKSQLLQLKKVTKCPVVILDGYKPEAAADRQKVKYELKQKIGKIFEEFYIFDIPFEDKDPNDLHREGKLKSYIDSVYDKILENIW